jgi:hypothetical protein
MRILKFFSVFCLILLLCNSCEKEKAHQIVFYSVDQLKQDLAVKVNKTDGYAVSVNSNAVINLKSSAVFKKNIDLLKDVEVQQLSFKIKNFSINSLTAATKISNIAVYVDEIKITRKDIKFDFLSLLTNGFNFKIDNQEIFSAISSKLLQKKQVVVSYYSDAESDKLFNFDLEFLLTAKGTFVD